MRPRALLLDFDGVVVESVDVKTNAFRQLFAHEPEHLPRIIELHLRQGGISRFTKFDVIYRDILRRALSPSDRETLGRRFADLVVDGVLACPPVPGAVEFLAEWSVRLPLFLVSGTPEEELRYIVDRRGLARYFTEVHGSPRSKVDVARTILARHGWSPDALLMIGDAVTDHAAAAELGLPFVGRLPPDARSPFPPGATLVPDLRALGLHLSSLAPPVAIAPDGAA